MKRTSLILIVLAMATLGASVASAQSTTRIDHREWRQHQRIQDGWRNRELTFGERARLRTGQRHVHRMERRALRDGQIDRFERRRLARGQNVQSRRIYRLKHNRRASRIL